MTSNKRYLFAGVAIVLVILFYVLFWKRENFTWSRNIQENPGPYSVESNAPRYEQVDSHPTSLQFADIASQYNTPKLPTPQKPLEFLDNTDFLPDVSTNPLMFDAEVANPKTFMFRPQVRVQLKSKQFDTSDPFRGDLPIQKGCNQTNGWFNSQFNIGDSRLDGAFSQYFNSAYKSYPQTVSNEELIMDNY